MRVVKTVSGSKVVVANNIGTVSYSSGLVNLVSFAPPAISGNTLNITITSASNDITPVREQILVINTEDVTTSAIADNTDATGSVTTSSSIGY